MNRSPGPTSRESKVTPSQAKSAEAVPPVAAAISEEVQRVMKAPPPNPSCRTCSGLHRAAKAMGQGFAARWTPEQVRGDEEAGSRPSRRRLPRHGDVVEGQHHVADDLALFMALAGEQHNIVRARHVDRGGDRMAAAADLG